MLVLLVVAIVLLAVALGIAWWLEHRRRSGAAPVRTGAPVPPQLVRADFPRPDAPWLVVLFSSSTCDSCAAMRERVAGLERDGVAVVDVEFSADRDLHERYAISGVPMVLIVDAEGVVRESFVGPATSVELARALSAVTESGSRGR